MQTKSDSARYWHGLKLEDVLKRDFRYAQGMWGQLEQGFMN